MFSHLSQIIAYLELNVLGNSDTILSDLWCTIALLQHNIAPLWAESDLQQHEKQQSRTNMRNTVSHKIVAMQRCFIQKWLFVCKATCTASASLSTPSSIEARPSTPNLRSLPVAMPRACLEPALAARLTTLVAPGRIIAAAQTRRASISCDDFREQSQGCRSEASHRFTKSPQLCTHLLITRCIVLVTLRS
jgi:hypothetical protein